MNRTSPRIDPLRALLAALLVSATACSKAKDGSSPPEVLATGAEPRASISFEPRPPSKRACVLEIALSVALQQGTFTTADKRVAPVRVSLQTRSDPAIEGSPYHGSFEIVDVTLEEAGADPEVYKQWKDDLDAQTPRGLKGKITADGHGRVTKVDLRMPDPSPNTVRQMLQSVKSGFDIFAAPRPDADVGIGAKLRDRRSISLSGLVLDTEAVYTLVAADDDKLTFDVEMTMHGQPQAFELPGRIDKGTRAQLLSASATAKGRTVVARRSIFPLEGTLSIPVEMEVRVLHEGKEARMQSSIDLTLKLLPK